MAGFDKRQPTMETQVMKRLSRVLCAVDLGEPGRAAFAQALALARGHDAKMIVVYAVPPTQSFHTGADDRLAYLLTLRAAAEAAGLEVRIDVQHGEASKVILRHARTRQPDLIVLSARHGAAMNGDSSGSVVEPVVRGARCPTLVVQEHQKSTPWRRLSRVLCAVDFSAASDAAIERAASLATGVGGRLTLLHVVRTMEGSSYSPSMGLRTPKYLRHSAGSALQRLQSLIPTDLKGPVRVRVAAGRVASEILRVACASQTDIVVVGTQARGRMRRRVFGVIRDLLKKAPCPILAVPAAEARLEERATHRPAA
jgi:nucleotide-binding universal stress UspA family protein